MSKIFIRNPVVAIVISILMVTIGLVSMFSLPTALFPEITPPEILVQANYPGADAKTLEQAVATPIEQQLNGVDHMNYMYSTNANNGVTSITVNFDVKTDRNIDQVLTQQRVSQAVNQLPSEVPAAGLTVQSSLAAPMMVISLASPNSTHDSIYMSNYAYINLVDDLTRVPGVSRVQIFGAGPYALRVWVDPNKLAKLNVTVPEVTQAIETQNNAYPAGQIGGEPAPNGQAFTYTVRTQGRLITPEQFGAIVLRANPDGSILRLRDVARIELGAQTYNTTGHYKGKPAAILCVYQLPGSNAVDTAKRVRARMAELQLKFPPDMIYKVTLDTTDSVRAGIHEIIVTLLLALALVVLVVYLFLQSWRATLIPLMAVPVSLIGTFIIFPFLGFSINTLSLFGLVLAIGLVVDDAIVVVEAVEHHIAEGLSPLDAAFLAMEEVSKPVIAIALILAAVFIPTAFVPGITGRLYQQFAVTIAISVIFSAFNALTLSPALCAMLLKPKMESNGPLARFFRWFNRVFGRTTDGYVKASGLLVRRSSIALIFLVVITGIALLIGIHLPGGFLPTEDQGYVYVALQLPDGASLQRSIEAASSVEQAVLRVPGVQGVNSVVGFSLLTFTQSTYNSFFFVVLKDWDDRKSKEEQFTAIQQNIARELAGVKQGLAFSFPPPAILGVGTSGGVTFVLEDRSGSNDTKLLTTNLMKFLDALSKRPEIAVAIPTYYPSVPQLYVDIDREKAMQQQVKLSDVYTTMQTLMGGYLVNYFNRFGRQWQTYVQAEGDYRTNIQNIGQYYVTSANGAHVPLSALMNVHRTEGPEFTMRFNEYEAAQITISGAPGYSSGQVMKALEDTFHQTMPPEMGYDYQGMSYQEKRAQEGVSPWLVFALSALLVFLILAAQYGSWTLPFSVLLSTPVALFGAYLALDLRMLENDVYAQIGIVMLIGLSAKNAILIVEFAKAELKNGESIYHAALKAARLRFRPIIMTAFAFILGCVPLWTARGSGGVSRQILGTVVIGGMLASTVLAVFLVPVTFAVIERISHFFGEDRDGSLMATRGQSFQEDERNKVVE
jgi:hydrophobic/amphiphilic exporter-1 (mainly G- bacteria), HAE1 family